MIFTVTAADRLIISSRGNWLRAVEMISEATDSQNDPSLYYTLWCEHVERFDGWDTAPDAD